MAVYESFILSREKINSYVVVPPKGDIKKPGGYTTPRNEQSKAKPTPRVNQNGKSKRKPTPKVKSKSNENIRVIPRTRKKGNTRMQGKGGKQNVKESWLRGVPIEEIQEMYRKATGEEKQKLKRHLKGEDKIDQRRRANKHHSKGKQKKK